MIFVRTLCALALVTQIGLAVPAAAITPFSEASLAEAQRFGKPIVIEVYAPWCPTCRAQREVLDQLELEQRFWQVVRLELDFDSQQDAMKALGARVQSTLIVFKGGTEVGRLAGATNAGVIEALLAKGL